MSDGGDLEERDQDQGSVLVMGIVLVLVLGLLVGAIASYAATSFGLTTVVRTNNELRASAEAGLRVTIDQLGRGQTLCGTVATAQPLTIRPNDADVAVQCTNIGGANIGANAFAVILTGVGTGTIPSLISSGGGTRKIGGAVYLAVPTSHDVTDLELRGDLWYYGSSCATTSPPNIPDLEILPSPPRTQICTELPWSSLLPVYLLPPRPATQNPAGRDDLVSGCRIFYPGTYESPPDLAPQNYFVSGDYYFEFDGPFEVKQSVVIGGNIDPNLGDTQFLSAPNCDDARDNPAVGGAENGFGNTWFLGRGAWIDIRNQGQIELFRRLQGTNPVSLMAIPTTTGGYQASTITLAAGQAIISTQSGSNNDMVIHGLINAPKAQVEFGNVSNTANAQVLGGLIAAGIDMQSSASASGFVISRATVPAQTKLVVRSTATNEDGDDVTVQAVLDYQPSRYVIDGVLTSGSAVVDSATASFTTADIGSAISGPGIPGGATITGVTSATRATMSIAATASGSARRVVIETPQIAINSWRKV